MTTSTTLAPEKLDPAPGPVEAFAKLAESMAQKPLQLIKEVLKLTASSGYFEKTLNKVEVLSAGTGWCNYGLKLEEEHLNSSGVALHGGLVATMVDTLSTYTLMTMPPHKPGVSVNLSIQYLKAAKLGEEIIIETKVLKAGRTLAFLDVDIKRKSNEDLLYQGNHVKHIG